jgi:putative flippase GtrA
MDKKDVYAGAIVGGAVGVLVQPMLSTLGDTLMKFHISVNATVRLEFFIAFLILGPLALFIASLIGRAAPVAYQFAKFAAVGTLNSFIDFGFMNLMIALTGLASGAGYVLFKAISFVLATTNSFFWNKYWTFSGKSGASGGEELRRFYSIALVGWGLNVGAASLLVNFVSHPGVSDNLWANAGTLLGIAVSLFWNFVGYKFFVFTERSK